MNKRDLLADLEAIREGATLFGDPNPGVNTQYELYEVAEHAIERALKAEALVQELVEALEYIERLTELVWQGVGPVTAEIRLAVEGALEKAKEVLGDE